MQQAQNNQCYNIMQRDPQEFFTIKAAVWGNVEVNLLHYLTCITSGKMSVSATILPGLGFTVSQKVKKTCHFQQIRTKSDSVKYQHSHPFWWWVAQANPCGDVDCSGYRKNAKALKRKVETELFSRRNETWRHAVAANNISRWSN